jgi:hypothetical protein
MKTAASSVYDVQQKEIEQNKALKVLKSVKPRKGLKPYKVPDDPFNTVFWCATKEKGIQSIKDYLHRKRYI